MKRIRHRAILRARVRDQRHRAVAIERFQEWDQAMTRRYGPMYHRAMRYTVH